MFEVIAMVRFRVSGSVIVSVMLSVRVSVRVRVRVRGGGSMSTHTHMYQPLQGLRYVTSERCEEGE